jgi:multiple sugar transport system ATP-binding protein
VSAVALRGVRKRFGAVETIHGVDLDVAAGELCVLVGPSGCGKSTLLRIVAGLEAPTAGDVMIGGEVVTDRLPAERGVAMVFQSYALYPHMTAYENLAFGLRVARRDRATVARRVRDAARALHIEPLLDRRPRQLSGGQRQRVAIGRAITREPRVFLLDEPLSNLDAALRVEMRLELLALKRRLAATMLYVTHDQVEAMTLADRLVLLDAGRVVQIGPPLDLYERPRTRFAAGFLGTPRMSFLDAETVSASPGAVTVRLAGGATLAVPIGAGAPQPAGGTPLTLGIRPEHVLPDGRGDATVPGRVAMVERLGAETYAYLSAEGGTLVARIDPAARVAVGDLYRAGLPARACHLFDGAGLALPRA